MTTIDTITTRIDPIGRADFDCYATVDEVEEYIGSAKTRAAAEKLCRDYRYNTYADGHCPEQAAAVVLDAASERCDGLQFPCGEPATETIETGSPGADIAGNLVRLPPMRLCAAHAAEWHSWQADEPSPQYIPAHVAVEIPGLTWQMITIRPQSTVALVKRTGHYNDCMSLLIDGQHSYDLVMCKHLVGRPEIKAALDQALKLVQDAITALRLPVGSPTLHDTPPSGCSAGSDMPSDRQAHVHLAPTAAPAGPDALAAASSAAPCSKCGAPSDPDAALGPDMPLCASCGAAAARRLLAVMTWTGPRCTECGEPIEQPGRCADCQADPSAPSCPACDGPHDLAHCREFAAEWRRQDAAERPPAPGPVQRLYTSLAALPAAPKQATAKAEYERLEVQASRLADALWHASRLALFHDLPDRQRGIYDGADWKLYLRLTHARQRAADRWARRVEQRRTM